MQRKVLLAAIAKDEGAYLPEWIHYHLRAGFSGIEIYVNQTTDESYEILSRISKRDSRVKFRNADYLMDSNYAIDYTFVNRNFLERNKIQARAYNEILKTSHGLFTHVMFLDIDEFFISLDGNDIDQFLSKYDYDVVSMNWFNQSGDSQPFDLSIRTRLRGEWKRQIKSIIKLPDCIEDVEVINTHQAVVRGGTRCEIGPEELEERAQSEKVVSESHFILHRWMRSEKEYLALIIRGDTFRNASNGFKITRPGWSDSYKQETRIAPDFVSKFEGSFRNFLRVNDIVELLHKSQEFVLERSESLKGKFLEIDQLHQTLKRVLSGTSLVEKPERDHTELIRDSAFLLEDIDLPKASALMELALESRPNAIELINKDIEYRERLESDADEGIDQFLEIAMLLEIFDTKKAYLIMNLLKKSKPDDKFISRKIREYKKAKSRVTYLENAMKFRDAAILSEGKNKASALQLMKLAQVYNPDGPLINRKIEEYSRDLTRLDEGNKEKKLKWRQLLRKLWEFNSGR